MENKPAVSAKDLAPRQFFEQAFIKDKFKDILGKRATSFVTSVLQIINSNELLKKATSESIYHAAMVAATLDLPLNNSLGFAYIVPFGNQATFQMGYRGFIQLAQRSGQFKSIYASEIYEGQLIAEDPLEGYVFDFTKKTSDNIIGYAARFKLLNGYEATFYMSNAQLKAHAMRYSQTFKRNSGQWKDNFDAMAKKTVIKLLLSKFAPLSVDMQKAQLVDQSIINDEDATDVTYIDATKEIPEAIDHESDRLIQMINTCKTLKELQELEEYIASDNVRDIYNTKVHELNGKLK